MVFLFFARLKTKNPGRKYPLWSGIEEENKLERYFVGERIWKKGSTKPSIKRNCRSTYPL
jgi:hypothetical protein